MVAEGHCVESELIEDGGDCRTLVEGIEEGSLELVAGIEEQRVLLGRTVLFDDRLDAGITTNATWSRIMRDEIYVSGMNDSPRDGSVHEEPLGLNWSKWAWTSLTW